MAAALSTRNTEESDVKVLGGVYNFDSPCQRELMLAYFKVNSIIWFFCFMDFLVWNATK